MQETHFPSLGREDPLEKEMATHSSVLAWRIPWTEEPGGLQSMGSQSQSGLSHWTCTHAHLSRLSMRRTYALSLDLNCASSAAVSSDPKAFLPQGPSFCETRWLLSGGISCYSVWKLCGRDCVIYIISLNTLLCTVICVQELLPDRKISWEMDKSSAGLFLYPHLGTRWVFTQHKSCRIFQEVGPGGICGPSGDLWSQCGWMNSLGSFTCSFFFSFNSFFYWRIIALQNFVVFC